MTTVRHSPITSAEVRAAMFGMPVPGVRVVRQAWRTTADDSDELVLIEARDGWWVARRISDQLTVWAYAGDMEAEEGFDQLVDAARHSDHAWREATASMLD